MTSWRRLKRPPGPERGSGHLGAGRLRHAVSAWHCRQLQGHRPDDCGGDVQKALQALAPMGKMLESEPDASYLTRHFYQMEIEGLSLT